jgi:hypothetical protein
MICVNSDPPMRPLFTWHHLSTDELVASWMFFCGTFQLLPYMLIYLVEEGSKLVLFLVGGLVVVLICQYIWVRQCYPHEDSHVNIIIYPS